jgi:hypothetical protein
VTARSNPYDVFDPVDFIRDGTPHPLQPSAGFPFLYNDNGRGRQLERPQGRLIDMAPENPLLNLGSKYTRIRHWTREVEPDRGAAYPITQFDFLAAEVHYQPLLATRENAQAFGMTLLKNGESVRFPYDDLVMTDYTYGWWAGYQSPYLGRGRGRELLVINPTDLEYHGFPHVFFSRDALPLVISVARWRPYVDEITLADLWLPPGDALVLPPKTMPHEPAKDAPVQDRWPVVLDLHGNRNSAQACRFVDGHPRLETTTILASPDAMIAPTTKPHYHEEKAPTRHVPL